MSTGFSNESGMPADARAPDARCFAPATQRNRQPILDVLYRVLPGEGLVLEVASGTGEHALWFAQHLRPLAWQPSDSDPLMRRSITGHAAGAGLRTLLPPLDLDVTRQPWPIERADAVVCINLIHIAPWEVALGLLNGAAAVLPAGGVLYLYGPYKRDGRHTAPSNAAFDENLQAQNPTWGVRDMEEVVDESAARGLAFQEAVEMPANNLSLVFKRS